MNKSSISFKDFKQEILLDEAVRDEYEKLRPRYEVISQIIAVRKEQNMTQAELAKKMGTQKSNISRLESGNYNPSLDFLIKVVQALGKRIEIEIR